MTIASLLEVRLGKLGDYSEEAEQLAHVVDETNCLILPLDNGLQLWKYVRTPMYRRLVVAQDTMYR